MGSIFLRDRGGYAVVLRSLVHYKKRLRTIDSAPGLAGAPMFLPIIRQEAIKTYPLAERAAGEILRSLADPARMRLLENELPLFQRALESYRSDLLRMQASGDDTMAGEIGAIDEAIREMWRYS